MGQCKAGNRFGCVGPVFPACWGWAQIPLSSSTWYAEQLLLGTGTGVTGAGGKPAKVRYSPAQGWLPLPGPAGIHCGLQHVALHGGGCLGVFMALGGS